MGGAFADRLRRQFRADRPHCGRRDDATIDLPPVISWQIEVEARERRHRAAGAKQLEPRPVDVCGNGEIGHDFTNAVMHSHIRSEEHTSELQSLMRISYAVFCLKKKKKRKQDMKTPLTQ